MEYIKEIIEFLWAVINNWAGYTTGGIAVALVWLWSTLRQVPVSRTAGVALASAFLLAAFFNAWRDQHEQVKTLKGQLDRDIPALAGVIHYVQPYYVKNEKEDLTEVFLSATITNNGLRSFVTGWRLHYKSKTKDVDNLPYYEIPEEFTVTDKGGKLLAKFHRSNSLAELGMKPLDRGEPVRGWLRFRIPGDVHDEAGKGATLTLSFEDYRAFKYSTAITTSPSSLGYFPGIERPF